jgi:Putative adhesin
MNRALKIGLLSVGGCYAAISLAGCKASACPDTAGPDGGTVTRDNCVQLEPTYPYEDKPRLSSTKWATGQAISIKNQNGEVAVSADSTVADEVQVSGTPFTRDTKDAAGQQSATNRLGAMANPTVTTDVSGVIVSAPGGGVFDGYRLTVHVPAGFDGAIAVTGGAGEVTLHSAAGAKSTTIHNGAGKVTADNLTGTIDLSTGSGDLSVSATPSGPGNVLHTEVGDINVSIGMANLKISATPEGGMVTFPAAWGMPILSTDMKTSSVTIGDGSGALVATTGLGSIFFQ